mmetsp:Transcript_623/g.530  ORF Transcript_623/g.530 Transcript_623/m.530 type:complete len:216 (-) Transcript_623:53-700(-)
MRFSLFKVRKNRLDLIVEVDEVLKNINIESDRGRIKQILLNLLSNSLKFTFQGSITLSATVKETLDGQNLQFGVVDTGVGIKDEDQNKLFTLFGMAKSDRGLNPNGCGIGLTVCKRYLAKLGGDIKLTSKYQQGTSTKFTIPLPREMNLRNNKFMRGPSRDRADSIHNHDESSIQNDFGDNLSPDQFQEHDHEMNIASFDTREIKLLNSCSSGRD